MFVLLILLVVVVLPVIVLIIRVVVELVVEIVVKPKGVELSLEYTHCHCDDCAHVTSHVNKNKTNNIYVCVSFAYSRPTNMVNTFCR